MYRQKKSFPLSVLLTGIVAAGAIVSTGCQTSIGGQTLPSAFYLKDDIQYFAEGPEFKLQREAAALKAARAQEQLNR